MEGVAADITPRKSAEAEIDLMIEALDTLLKK